MADWKITKKVEGCARCDHDFEEGERHFSLLMFDAELLGRENRCGPCFTEDLELPPELVFWRTRRHIKPKRGLAVDFDSIEKLFLALEGREEPRLAELRFLLSLLLMRKRRIKMVRVKRTEGAEYMICRRPRREDLFHVQVFDLTSERAAQLKAELERIFEGAGAEELEVPTGVSELPPILDSEADEPVEGAEEAPVQSEETPVAADSPGELREVDARE